VNVIPENWLEPSTSVVVAVLIGVFALMCGLVLLLRKPSYERQQTLLTPAERVFMKSLKRVVGGQLWIAAKVRVADVLRVEKVRSEKKFWRAFTKISSKHLDFVLTTQDDYRILACIELDDSSHARADRKKRDRFLDAAFQQSGIPLVRFRVRRGYGDELIRTALANAGIVLE